jgi:Tfp pilus assembly protein PilF
MTRQSTGSLFYVKAPPEAARLFENASGSARAFVFNPDIPLPVEFEGAAGDFKREELCVEMIVSGMLRVISEESEHENGEYYRRLVAALRPNIVKELGGAALIKARNGEYGLAREILRALTALFPASGEVLFLNATVLEEEAEALERAGDKAAAAEDAAEAVEKAYTQALAVESPQPDALFNAAFFLMKRHDFGRARDYFQEYAATAEDGHKKRLALSQARLIEQRQLDDEHFYRAYRLVSSGKEEAGMNELRVFLERRPDVWNGWFLLGWALRRLGRWEDGAAAFRKAMELGGVSCESRNELAICLIEMGEWAAARRELEAALAEAPENVKIISNLGTLHLRRGERKTAEGFFRAALELAPQDAIARAFFAGGEG